MKEITEKQKQILDFIKDFHKGKGYPPTVKEIMTHFNFASPTSVTTQLMALEKKGYIKKNDNRARGIIPVGFDRISQDDDFVKVPLIGDVKAGELMAVCDEDVSETYLLPKSFVNEENVFLMKVHGDSMINAYIKDNDLILVKKTQNVYNKDIVVAIVNIDEGEEITVKRFFQEKNKIKLMPENQDYKPIIADSVKIVGKVISVFRLNM